ncbi:hypothetical protein T11_10220 [Trichinella zimbabwensis]|uniref:Uncharacterized protein n=1 Tax=Trichinella zimbabwensis TaxID=268475 RepID=A0A0V1HCK9_9BILA|nr:hypothetical protein T11_10220 [Trichinella zimbabwensis]
MIPYTLEMIILEFIFRKIVMWNWENKISTRALCKLAFYKGYQLLISNNPLVYWTTTGRYTILVHFVINFFISLYTYYNEQFFISHFVNNTGIYIEKQNTYCIYNISAYAANCSSYNVHMNKKKANIMLKM